MILFIDQTGQLGGAELCLLDIVTDISMDSRVVLFQDGPFRDRLEKLDIEVLVCKANLDRFRRHSGPLSMAAAMTSLTGPIWELLTTSHRSDVFYANTQKAAIAAFIAGLLGGRQTVWHLHDIITSPHFSSFGRRIMVNLANLSCSHVIANSEASLKAFREAGGQVPATVVYNGIDPKRFVAGEQTPTVWRQNLGLDELPTVGIFGRLAEWKGQLHFVEAVAKCDGIQGIIVGDALFGGDAAYATKVRDRVTQLGIGDRIRILGFRDDVPQLMAACDAVVHASTDPEPFGRVIAEAMLSRRTIIATRGGGAMELVGQNNERGILVDAGDVAQLEQAIQCVLSDAALRARLVPQALNFAEQNFSPKKILENIEMILRETVGSQPGRRPTRSEVALDR